MALYNDFKKALAAGQVGEEIAAEYMTSLGYEVIDVSDNEEYFSKDIDLIAKKGDEVLMIEVKADSIMHNTKNAVVETITNKAWNKAGWFFTTEATHIFFTDVVTKEIHVVRIDELRKLYEEEKWRFHHRNCSQYEAGYIYKESQIALVGIQSLRKTEHYNFLDAAVVAANQ